MQKISKEELPKDKKTQRKGSETKNNKRKSQDTPEVVRLLVILITNICYLFYFVLQQKDKENAETENPPKRRSARITRSTRSMAEGGTPSPEKEVPEKLPYIKYSGAIKYFTEVNDIAASADEVM